MDAGSEKGEGLVIDYSVNPLGDVLWRIDSLGCKRGKARVARIDITHYLEIVAHTTNETAFRARLWNEVSVEYADDPALGEARGKRRKVKAATATV